MAVIKKEYWSICFNIKPYMCSSITYVAVISEPIRSFLVRQEERITLLSATKTTKNNYNLLKDQNPSNESYVKLCKSDYGYGILTD